MSRLEAECLFLGTAIFLTPFLQRLQELVTESGRWRIVDGAITRTIVQVRPADGTETLALFTAERFHGQTQHDLMPYHLVKVAERPFEREDFDVVIVIRFVAILEDVSRELRFTGKVDWALE